MTRLADLLAHAPTPRPCRYCGHVAVRLSDDDCPLRPWTLLRRAFLALAILAWLLTVAIAVLDVREHYRAADCPPCPGIEAGR